MAVVEAVLAGDQFKLCAEGAYEDAVLGDALPSSAVRPEVSTVVLMNGTAGRFVGLARWTMVCVPVVPSSFALRLSAWSDSR